jgi:hypothetical protein
MLAAPLILKLIDGGGAHMLAHGQGSVVFLIPVQLVCAAKVQVQLRLVQRPFARTRLLLCPNLKAGFGVALAKYSMVLDAWDDPCWLCTEGYWVSRAGTASRHAGNHASAVGYEALHGNLDAIIGSLEVWVHECG